MQPPRPKPSPSPAQIIHQLRSELLAVRREKVGLEASLRAAQSSTSRAQRRDPRTVELHSLRQELDEYKRENTELRRNKRWSKSLLSDVKVLKEEIKDSKRVAASAESMR
eukprot:984485-Pleurochrysis_carterae.AAC.1